jgi:hypothetical protein
MRFGVRITMYLFEKEYIIQLSQLLLVRAAERGMVQAYLSCCQYVLRL